MKWISKPPLGTQLDWSNPLNKGLAGFWLMNEGMGNKVQDLSMNGNTGTLTGIAFPPTAASGWNPGRKGVGLNFDGVNDYISIPDNDVLTNSPYFTWSFWAKQTTYVSGAGLLDKYYTTGNQRSWRIRSTSTNKLSVTLASILTAGTDYETSLPAGFLSDNTFYHFVIIYDGVLSKLHFYRDGVFIETINVTQSGNLANNTIALYIGRYQLGANFFNGTIDEVRIQNRALSASEIKELYINPYGMFL